MDFRLAVYFTPPPYTRVFPEARVCLTCTLLARKTRRQKEITMTRGSSERELNEISGYTSLAVISRGNYFPFG